MLDRLSVLGGITWVREPDAIHVTVSVGGQVAPPAARPDTTQSVTDAIRTPDVLLEGLPDFPWEPQYRQVEGLRLAHVDEGDGAPVVFWHGEPTWSFLWRKVAPPVLEAGYRAIMPDLPGFGRSDKPIDEDWYSYDRHVAAATRLVEDLDLRGATFVCHDWGGPIGLRVAVELADRVDRLVLMDTGVFTGEQPMSEEWHRFREFVERVEELPVSLLVRRACATDPGDEVAAAYDAPFPSEASKAGARAFPAILPLAPGRPRRGGRPAHAGRAARGHAADADPVGRLGPGAAGARRRGARERARQAGAAGDRGRRPLPPGGPGRAGRRPDRGLAALRPRRRSAPGSSWTSATLLGGRGARGDARLVGGALGRVDRDGDLVGLHRVARAPRGRGAAGSRRPSAAARSSAGRTRRSAGP